MAEINPVLVVVDVQNGFVTEHSKHVLPVIEALTRTWIHSGRDVVFTRYINYDGSPFERVMGWSKLKTSPEIDVVDDLVGVMREALSVIDKGAYSLFNDEGTILAQNRQWTDLFVCGIDTEVCVLKTAVDAFERGIRSWLISDASASHAGPDLHRAGVLVAQKMIGKNQVVDSTKALDFLRHPSAY